LKFQGDGTFTAIGINSQKPASECWREMSFPRLWLYNLHYLDDLANPELSDRAADEVLTSWQRSNPPCSRPAWEPYPTSLRIVNMSKRVLNGGSLPAAWPQLIATQAEAVARNLEYHLLVNHLLANAKALVFAGTILDGERADRIARTGLQILHAQIPDQILPSGAHCELSPMYHAIVVEDLIDLLNLAVAYPRAPVHNSRFLLELSQSIQRMITWLRRISPDPSLLPRFNDSADGVSLALPSLERYANSVSGGGAPSIAQVGPQESMPYVRLRSSSFDVIFDVAPVGPDFNPGHGHADTLSFEMYVKGSRVVANCGTSTYEPGEQRAFERSTAAHNAVIVDGSDSSEMWGAFRVGRRARVRDVHVSSDGLSASGAHTGFCHLPGSPLHTRALALSDDVFSCRDSIVGRGTYKAEGHLHFEPDVEVERVGDCIMLTTPAGRLNVSIMGAEFELSRSTAAIGFGAVKERVCARWTRTGTGEFDVTTIVKCVENN
jgi:uncharacterized heparinase superfamily protein